MSLKILYGVQGTGNGHISRTRMMAKYFKQHDVDVTYLFSGRERDKFFDMEIFGDYLHCKGLTLHTKAGKLNLIETACKNALIQFIQDVRKLDLSQYDLIINDFEPVTAWAAKFQNKPIIGTGHQYSFGPRTPKEGDSLMARLVMKSFAPIKTTVGQHWYPYEANTVPPVIDSTLAATDCHGAYVVYLPFEDQEQVTDVLKQFPNERFIQYSPELIDREQANVSLRKTRHDAFKQDLMGAKGVICNSGFELNSECIHIGLPVLTKPLAGQMEQLSNAKVLAELGFADRISEVTVASLRPWLKKDKTLRPNPFPDVAQAIVEWVMQEDWQNIDDLRESLWLGIVKPESIPASQT